MRRSPFADDGVVVVTGFFEHLFIQALLGAGIQFPIEQEATQFRRPELAALFEEELQFTQEVLVAQSVQDHVFVIGLPVVMG